MRYTTLIVAASLLAVVASSGLSVYTLHQKAVLEQRIAASACTRTAGFVGGIADRVSSVFRD